MLKDKKAVILSSSGAPTFYTRFIKRCRGLNLLKKDTLEFCGIKTKAFLVGPATKLTEKNKLIIKNNVTNALEYLS